MGRIAILHRKHLAIAASLCFAGSSLPLAQGPLVAERPAGKALVYFIDKRPQKSRTPVFLDLDALGDVVGMTYFHVLLDPGSYLLWGDPADSQWFEFKADRNYVLVIAPEYTFARPTAGDGFTNTGTTTMHSVPGSWLVEDPRPVGAMIRQLGLERRELDEEQRAKLRRKISRRKYERAMRQAGQPFDVRVPDTFHEVRCRLKRQSVVPDSIQRMQRGGRLTVDSGRVQFVAANRQLEIPLSTIRAIEGSRDELVLCLEIRYETSEGIEDVYFLSETYAQHNRIMLTILEAMARGIVMLEAPKAAQRLCRGWVVALAVATLGISACGRTPAARPDIVLIVVDTLRQDRLGCYGAERATSPNIDALARQGTRFERAYSTSPWTSPAVAAMFTGLYPSSHGLHNVRHPLRDDLDTLAELLRDRGYATAGIVSHTLLGREFNFHQGFTFWSEEEAAGHDHVSSNGVTRRAIEQIDRLAEGSGDGAPHQPFFLFVHYFDPHHRYVAHPEHGLSGQPVGRVTGEESIEELRALGETLTESELQFLRGLYDEEIRHTDEGIGRLLDRLAEVGLDEHTIVALTADHGEAFLDHGWLGHTRDLYEELVRVPLIVRTPQGLHGRTVESVVSLVALAPTLFDLAGLDAEGLAFQASSLAPLVVSGDGGMTEPVLCEVDFDPVYEKYREKRAHRKALVGQRFKLIRDDESDSFELYDLVADPGETRNVADEHSSVTLDFIEVIDRLVPELRSVAVSPGDKQLTPEQIEQLRALGYVGR